MLKATWNGEGQPPSGVSEYGAGTDNPTIPLGILRQRKDPDSNWSFEYVAQSPSKNEIYAYLSQPVWFYTNQDGEGFYAERQSQIPPDAKDVKKGKYADLYNLASSTKRAGKGLIASDHDKLETDKTLQKQQKTIQALRNIRVTLKDPKKAHPSLFDMKKTQEPGEGFSVLPLYLMAMKQGNTYLMDKLEGWITKTGVLQLGSTDLFENDSEMMRGMQGIKGVSMAEKILSAESWDDLNKVMANYYAFVAEKNAPPEKSTPAPVVSNVGRPLPETLQIPAPLEIPRPIPQETPVVALSQKIEFVPARLQDFEVSTDFSRKYSATEIGKGQHYIKNIPDEILEGAFGSLSPAHQSTLAGFMPGFFKRERDPSGKPTGGYILVGKPARTFEGNQPLTVGDQALLIEAIASFEVALDKANPEFCISNAATNYSPLFTLKFPYMSQLGKDSENAFAAMQGAFRYSLKQEMMKSPEVYGDMLADMEGDMFGSINLTEIKDQSILTRALSNIWQYKTAADAGGNILQTPLGVMVSTLVEKTALTEEQIQNTIQGVLKDNLASMKTMKDRLSPSQGVFGGRSMSSAGRALGMLVNNHTAGIKLRDPRKQGNTLIQVAQDQLGVALEKLLGQRVEVALGDSVTYQPANGGSPRTFSLGLMQYLHNFLPYHLNASQELIAEVGGVEYNLDKLEGEERDQIVDTLMQEIENKCNIQKNEALDSQSAIYNITKKYQEGIYADKVVGKDAVFSFGAKKPLSKLKDVDNIHHNTAALQKATEVASSLGNYVFSDLEAFLMKGKMEPDQEALVTGGLSKSQVLDSILIRKQNEIMQQSSEIAEAFGVPMEYRLEFEGILDASIEAMRENMVRLFEPKGSINSTTFGGISEQLQMLIPVVSAMKYHSERGERMDFQTGARGYFHTGLTFDEIAGDSSDNEKSSTAFFKGSLPMRGFHYKVGDKDSFILKEERPSGFGDLIHIEDSKGDAIAHTFEGKNSRMATDQNPHISQVSPFMRNILKATRNASSVRIGKVSTLQLSYGWMEEAKTPLGLVGSSKSKTKFAYPKYGIPREGSSSVAYTRLMGSFSNIDGPGLVALGVQ